jgi:hypothetical protein
MLSGDVPFAAEFDVLTSEELKDVMEHINHWYRHAHRNRKKSCNHGKFEDFVGDKPFVYYYHLWLQEIPRLLSLAVPTLPETVAMKAPLLSHLLAWKLQVLLALLMLIQVGVAGGRMHNEEWHRTHRQRHQQWRKMAVPLVRKSSL